jgi:hypothetical protein
MDRIFTPVHKLNPGREQKQSGQAKTKQSIVFPLAARARRIPPPNNNAAELSFSGFQHPRVKPKLPPSSYNSKP